VQLLRPLPALIAVACLWPLTGCASSGTSSGPPRPAPPGGEASQVVDGRTGEPVSRAAVVARLKEVDVVYVGERHDRAADHALQEWVVAVLVDDMPHPEELAVGLEMVQRPFQPALDRWLAGETDQATMLEEVQWASRWGFDFGFYEPIFERVRAAGGQLIALNAPAEVTRAVGMGGLDALAPEDREALPELDLDDPDHRRMIEEALTGHGAAPEERGAAADEAEDADGAEDGATAGTGGGDDAAPEADNPHAQMDPAMLDRFYTAQVIWDETMAATVAETLTREGPGAARRMVVLAGRFHVQQGLGIPKRAARRGVGSQLIVLPVAPEELPSAVDGEAPLADLLWATGP